MGNTLGSATALATFFTFFAFVAFFEGLAFADFFGKPFALAFAALAGFAFFFADFATFFAFDFFLPAIVRTPIRLSQVTSCPDGNENALLRTRQ
jgi:hypothetical protein